jgi:hypothetical protein
MSTNLTDLMEQSVRTAPPEPHLAADITALAQRHQRRRTTGTAGLAALAVVVAGGLGYGLTRNHEVSPQPAERFKLDQTVDVSQAVPASSLPGYASLPWTIRSVQRLGSGPTPIIPTYHSIDSTGRLLVVDVPHGDPLQNPFRARLFDTPGGAAQPLQAPASPGTTGSGPISWLPEFYGADQLIWRSSGGFRGSPNGFHITDLQGGHDEFVPATFRVGGAKIVANADDVTGRSMWIEGSFRPPTKSGAVVFDVYRGTFSGDMSKVATGVSALDVGPGTAGWVNTHGQVFVQSDAGAAPQQVPVPLDKGCRVLPASRLQSPGFFAVTSSAVAISELCGSGDRATGPLLVFDLSGHPLVRVTGGLAFNLSFAGNTLLFQANGSLFRYDLVTGTLSRLNSPRPARFLEQPQGMGSFVLWYDHSGGHVARIPS